VFDASDPPPKTDQPVVPLSISAFVRRFPLAAKAGEPGPDTAISEATVKRAARPNERNLAIFFFTAILLFLWSCRAWRSPGAG
jgi:hypothetical protein